MPLDLELLPDKPQTVQKDSFSLDFSSLPDKPSSLNFDLLPDKPNTPDWITKGLKQIVPQEFIKTTIKAIEAFPITEEQKKHPIKTVFEAGARYPRSLFYGLEALQTSKPPLEAMKRGFLGETKLLKDLPSHIQEPIYHDFFKKGNKIIFQDFIKQYGETPIEQTRTPTQVAWDMANRVYGKQSTSVAWEFLKTLPYTTAGKLAEFQLDPSVFLTFQGINKVLTNPVVAKFMAKDITAPKWVDDIISNTIKGFYKPFENLAQGVKENRINALTDEIYKKFEPRMDELKANYKASYGTEPLEGDIKGLIKAKLVKQGIYDEPLINLQAKLFKAKGIKPLEPTVTPETEVTPPEVLKPSVLPIQAQLGEAIAPKPAIIPQVVAPVTPIIPETKLDISQLPDKPTVEGKVLPIGENIYGEPTTKLGNYISTKLGIKYDRIKLVAEYSKDIGERRDARAILRIVSDRIEEPYKIEKLAEFQPESDLFKKAILSTPTGEGFKNKALKLRLAEAMDAQKLNPTPEGEQEIIFLKNALSGERKVSEGVIYERKSTDERRLVKKVNGKWVTQWYVPGQEEGLLWTPISEEDIPQLEKDIAKGVWKPQGEVTAPTEGLQLLEQEIRKMNTNELETFIDEEYARGAPQEELGILETVYAERVSEENLSMTEEELTMGEGISVEEQLVNMYHRYLNPELRSGMEVKDILANMRSVIETQGFGAGGVKKNLSDKEILAAAKDAYDTKKALIERYKVNKEPKQKTKAKIIRNVVNLLPEDIEKVKGMRQRIAEGVAGKRMPVGEERTWIGIASTFPDYFRDKGYTKKVTLAIIDKILAGKPVTEKQQAIFENLLTGYKTQLEREVESYDKEINSDTRRAELKKQGFSESEIEGIIRIGEKEAQSEVVTEGIGVITGSKFFKTPEEADAYIDKAESLGGKAEIVRVSAEEVEVSYNLPETLTPSLEIRAELKPPLKKDLFQEEGELFRKAKGTGKAFAMPPGGLEEWIKRTQEQNVQLKPLEMPELVKLAVELMGKYPVVKKLVTNLGLFKFGKGIALDIKIFKNPQIAGIVLAHEIGHLIDWLPDYTIARGNILGRIATLKYYMKSLLAEKPGMEGTVLTQKDRDRLRRVAEAELTAEAKLGEREITEELIREIPIYAESRISAEEILSYWRSNETDIRVSNRELYDFIAKLSNKEKLSIIQQALKGIIDERIMKIGGGKRVGTKIVKEQIKRVVTPVEITPQNISRRFKQLLKEEIIKRKLFSNEIIKEELKRVTQWWNPFDDTRKGWFTSYRYGSDELYAEAISVLLNKPEKLEELAPQFYKAFWNYIDRKPEVKKALLELQDFLNMGEGEKLRVRQEDIYSMFKKGEELFYDKRKEYELRKKSIWFRLRAELITKNTALLDKLKEVEKQGKVINPEDNPKYYLEEYNYIGGKIKNLLGNIDEIVINPLEEQGITQENIGEYLFLNRVVTERADIANPLGQNKETAQRQLDYLHSLLGDTKFNLLKQSIDKFQGIMKELLLEAEKVGLYKPEIIEKLITNPAYATFQVLDYLDDYVAPSIINQIGTLKPIANPFASTILKMISTLRTIERIKTNNSVITFLSLHFPKEITEAKIRHFGKYKAEIVEKEGFEVIKTREGGKLAGCYVDPYIAQSVNASPRNINNAVISVLRFLNSNYFRPVYVNLNLGFQTFNAIRDFTRAWKLNPNVNFATHLGNYWKALPIAKQRIWGNFTNPVIKEMQQSGMLSFTYNNLMRGVSEGEETQVEFLLRQYDILKKNPQNPVMKVFNFIEELGDFIETIPKVAGYLSRLKSEQNIKEIAHEVRVFSGSPDFLRKGAGYDWYNNVFLFSNAIKEGIRGDIEGAFKNPKTRSGYWWRTAKVNFLPKILALLATLGFFGQKIKENFDKQTEYDKTNYNNIPLGLTEEGKAVYFRLPQDEMGRLLGGIFWKGMSGIVNKELKSVQDIGGLLGGQAPSMAPEIELLSSWAQYLTGKNPYDWFRGREILSDDEQMAGGWYSLKPMIGWTAGKLGIYGATIKAQNDETIWEKIIKFTPIVQRFIRITDYGETEIRREDRQERNKAKAIRKLERRKLR